MKYHRWTTRTIETLRMLYPIATWEEILRALPGHSYYSITAMARKQKLHRPRRNRDWNAIASQYRPVVLR